MIKRNIAEVKYIKFSSNPINILLCLGIGVDLKNVVKLKFCAQPMHQIYAMNIVPFLKLVHQNKNELPSTSMSLHNDSFQA